MSTPSPTRRTLAPDLARGLMLALIAVANSTWYLWGHGTSAGLHPTGGTSVDRAIQAVTMTAIDGRIYPMFAFLFGYGMVQFANAQERRGVPYAEFRGKLRRRHLGLLLFGLLHAALLFGGDILGAYGLLGLVLVAIFFRRSDKVLLVWAGVLTGLGLLFGGATAALGAWASSAGHLRDVPGAFDFGALRDALTGNPSYVLSIADRLIGWGMSTPGMLLNPVTLAAILLGWVAARRRVLEEPQRHRRLLVTMAIGGIALAWLGGLPGALLHQGLLPAVGDAPWAFLLLSSATGLFGGLGYIAAIALVAGRIREVRGGVRALAAVGKRSLTSYLVQSIVMAPLLAAWGLGLGGRLGSAGVVGVALGAWLLSIALASWLEATGRRGPFEVALRRITHGRSTPGA